MFVSLHKEAHPPMDTDSHIAFEMQRCKDAKIVSNIYRIHVTTEINRLTQEKVRIKESQPIKGKKGAFRGMFNYDSLRRSVLHNIEMKLHILRFYRGKCKRSIT